MGGKRYVVLDVDELGLDEGSPAALRTACDRTPWPSVAAVTRAVADQLDALTPPKPAEPGMWGVVEADCDHIPRRRWVHHEEDRWVCDTGRFVYWQELSDVEVVREGVPS